MPVAQHLICRDLVGLVTYHLEDALAPAGRVRFERHLDLCHGCRNHLDQMRTTIRIFGRLRCRDLDDGLCDSLLDAFAAWRTA